MKAQSVKALAKEKKTPSLGSGKSSSTKLKKVALSMEKGKTKKTPSELYRELEKELEKEGREKDKVVKPSKRKKVTMTRT